MTRIAPVPTRTVKRPRKISMTGWKMRAPLMTSIRPKILPALTAGEGSALVRAPALVRALAPGEAALRGVSVASNPGTNLAPSARHGQSQSQDSILSRGEVDAIYVATPNTKHRASLESAARAGVHVLCEKPLDGTVADCRSMLRTASEAKIKLMVAYRCGARTSRCYRARRS